MSLLDAVFPFLLYTTAACVAVAAAAVIWLRPRQRAQRQLLDLFGLDAREWRAVGSDLHGGELPAKKLHASGVAGVPDAVFVHRRERRVVVGDLKSRTANDPHLYERFQMLLYQGLAEAAYPRHEVEGLLRFSNKVLTVPFERHLFESLINLRDECRISRRRKKPVDPRPLATRLQSVPAPTSADARQVCSR